MEILRHAVVLVHLVGFAVLFGAWVVAAFGGRRFTRLMTWGMLIAAITMPHVISRVIRRCPTASTTQAPKSTANPTRWTRTTA